MPHCKGKRHGHGTGLRHVLSSSLGKDLGHENAGQPKLPGIVIFDLVDGYISPNWYPSKQIGQKVVPTWNYLTVHVHGTVALIDNSEWLEDLVTDLTISNESDQLKCSK